jgi:hypothetical protein
MEVKSTTPYLPCAFCSGEFASVEVVSGGDLPIGTVALGHTEPHYAEFHGMDPDVFLRAVRKRRKQRALAVSNN